MTICRHYTRATINCTFLLFVDHNLNWCTPLQKVSIAERLTVVPTPCVRSALMATTAFNDQGYGPTITRRSLFQTQQLECRRRRQGWCNYQYRDDMPTMDSAKKTEEEGISAQPALTVRTGLLHVRTGDLHWNEACVGLRLPPSPPMRPRWPLAIRRGIHQPPSPGAHPIGCYVDANAEQGVSCAAGVLYQHHLCTGQDRAPYCGQHT
ncbi:hypothetical protein JKP88DRAFT_261103 [Tribonema minus]|uniref:Uncharacterized protein n=1 Tax=Tribonema minus TaxID=303371 RepID=A0A835YUR9_9STRA|nr:hypothetical protein JKP88DRAFT_268831 [Tribonema minus]KAG5183293.1 hypothetical protein JKP88DRAFT_261103 [Tribonema minus]